jgi:hypothetical protein
MARALSWPSENPIADWGDMAKKEAHMALTTEELAAIRAVEVKEVKETVATRVWMEDVDAADYMWDMPWARDLELKYAGTYDCSAMSEKDYASFMRWLCARGFNAHAYGHRAIVCATDENLPPTEWVSTKPAGPKYVPRFCVRCPAGEVAADCCYEHGNTIARLNETCKFGDACTGPKRAACLRMHPGETWTASSVICR